MLKMTITTTITPRPMQTHAMMPIQLSVRLEVGAMLEEGSRLLSSGTLTEGREIELEDSSGSEDTSDEDSSASSGASRDVVGRFWLVVDGVCEGCCVPVFSELCVCCAGGSEEGAVAGGSVTGGVAGSGVDGSVGVVGVSEDGVVGSGVGSTAGAVGSPVGTVGSTVGVVGSVTGVVGSAAGGSDTGVRPMTCCCVLVDGSTGVSVANETVPNAETMPNSIVKTSKKALLCFFKFETS